MFLYLVKHTALGCDTEFLLIRSDHDPSEEEIVKALDLDYDEMRDDLEATRISEESIPTLPPKT
jgi:hypothetical protein